MRVQALAAAVAALAVATSASADYLEIRHRANLKTAPEGDAESRAALEEGTLVALTSEQQENGYYVVRTRDGDPGYVYRTLVRRHPGALPPDTSSPVGPAPGPPSPDDGTDDSAGSDPGGRPSMSAHLIDVEQGAATLFEFSCGAVLVDTGGEKNGEFDSGAALQNYLDAFFERRSDLNRTIDLLVVTHPHIDHARRIRPAERPRAELVRTPYKLQARTARPREKSPSGGS